MATAGATERFQGKYLSLTSFKRDGTPVATPVWFVAKDGHLLVETDADSYKVKRIRRNPHVRIALCDARGRLRGPSVEGEAEIHPESDPGRAERLTAEVPDRPVHRVPALPARDVAPRSWIPHARAPGAARDHAGAETVHALSPSS